MLSRVMDGIPDSSLSMLCAAFLSCSRRLNIMYGLYMNERGILTDSRWLGERGSSLVAVIVNTSPGSMPITTVLSTLGQLEGELNTTSTFCSNLEPRFQLMLLCLTDTSDPVSLSSP